MKNYLLLTLLALCAYGCSGSSIANKAERLVRANYPDCEKILMVDIDTITIGDNLRYRLKQQKQYLEFTEANIEMYQGAIKEFKQYGASGKSYADEYRQKLQEEEKKLTMQKQMISALDSLKAARADISDVPAAYQICVAYNYPTNLVWIQLDAGGTLLKISKRREDMLLNPGLDMPGYFDIIEKYRYN